MENPLLMENHPQMIQGIDHKDGLLVLLLVLWQGIGGRRSTRTLGGALALAVGIKIESTM